MKIGQVFYSNQKNSEWKIWHEITAINGNKITMVNYGKDTCFFESDFFEKDIRRCVRKGILIPA